MIKVKNKLLKNKSQKNKSQKNKLYGSHYDRLRKFMTHDEWVLKNIYEINYFGHSTFHLFEFKFIDETWFVRPLDDHYRNERLEKQILSYSFGQNRAKAQVLMSFFDEQRILFEKEFAFNELHSIKNPFDNKFKLKVLSILDLCDFT
jgi:hypothetical protein